MVSTNEFLSQQTLLIISPHPDDECFGCAGTISKIKSLGGKVYVIVVTVGDSKYYNSEQKSSILANERITEFENAMRFLGVDKHTILFRDEQTHERLDSLPRRSLVEAFEQTCDLSFDKIRPTIVAIPAISYNQDHEAVFRAAFTACRPGARGIRYTVPIVVTYENTSLTWLPANEKFHPQLYVDISDHVDKKVSSLGFYKSQIKDGLHLSNIDNVRNAAYVRGREISVEAAECYAIYRWIL